jgi:hypothetical protein
MENFRPTQAINGSFGEVWVDDEKFAEQKGLQAKVNFRKEDVNQAGKTGTGTKVIGWDGKGSLKLFKVNSRVANKVRQMVKEGRDVRFTIISKLSDPDALGSERVVLRYVSFDDLTLIDFEPKKVLEVDMPFTFEDYDLLDSIN